MAADTMASDSTGLLWDGTSKLFEKVLEDGTKLVIGNTGNCAVEGLVRFDDSFTVGPARADDVAWAQRLAQRWTEICWDRREVSKDGNAQLSLLVAVKGDIWEITENYAQAVDRYVSIGSGAQVAQGAMWSMIERFGLFGIDRLQDDQARAITIDAVRAACRWERGCREPVVDFAT